MKKKALLFIPLLSIIATTISGCNKDTSKTLNIIFTNDVHCAFETNIGYSGLSAYKNKLINQGNETMLVDCGDHVQGAPIGFLSKGSYIIEIMNKFGYEYAIPGNHEFDYTANTFINTIAEQANFKYLSSNFCRTKDGCPVFSQYEVVQKANYKIGLVGISTPSTIKESSPKRFQDKDGNLEYTFLESESIETFYDNVQQSINKCLEQKVNYVIALAHLGTEGMYNSEDLIKNINGLDVLLDGHSHDVVAPTNVKDKSGNNVIVTQTGTELNNIGNITISEKGLNVCLINKETLQDKDAEMTSFINSIKERYEKDISLKIGHTSYNLTIKDSDGNRLIRKKSTNMGDLVADAFKAYNKSDIALHNAGGIRSDILEGDILFKDAMTVCPFGNMLCLIKAKGKAIKNFIEYGAARTPEENGQLMIPSGLTYEINTAKPTPVELDNSGNFIRINGEYRVENILINGQPIEEEKEYTISGCDFNLCDSASAKIIFKDAQILSLEDEPDYKVLAKYIEVTCNGEIPTKYSSPLGEERIRLK